MIARRAGALRRSTVARVALGLSLAAGCGGKKAPVTHIDLRVDLAAGVAPHVITTLRTTVQDPSHSVTHDYERAGRPVLAFPVTVGIDVSVAITGPLRVDVQGLDAHGAAQAEGSIDALAITPGNSQSTQLWLACSGGCAGDGGIDAAPMDAGQDVADASEASGLCGNGVLDPGETCDVAIAAGSSGACPPAGCDDGIACTRDVVMGSGCTATCTHIAITALAAGDGCCPINATHLTDPDCSATCHNGTIEPGETCDTAIAPGSPGACPTADACSDTDPCTRDSLISANTCSARCVHETITTSIPGDGCCPAGATNFTDPDCPQVCGNGTVDRDETCDIAIPAGAPGVCPPRCPAHGPCLREQIDGTGCEAVCHLVLVTDFKAGDGCCPPGANSLVDPDCPAMCGNGVMEPMETCDKAIPANQQGACPTTCPVDPSGCAPSVLVGSSDNCNAYCVVTPITSCSMKADGCCPAGCTTANDPDCSPTCGNGRVEVGETCDTAIAPPAAGACPTRCDDANPCTADTLISANTCNARCQFTPITSFIANDGCCPIGGNHNVDSDCPVVCGNGVVEPPTESCDPGITGTGAGACPTTCPPANGCTAYVLTGTAATCMAQCESRPITACMGGDGCCPSGCNSGTDSDCPGVCGDALVEQPETCDKGITAGFTGSCQASCDDNDNCTQDSTAGRVEDCNRNCSHARITACASGDGCCPTGCTGQTDSDCVPVCGNGVVESAETCDPPSSCPTTCADDGDPCTTEVLSGKPEMCDVTCKHIPIVTCSGAVSDHCCPTPLCVATPGNPLFDSDCPSTTTTMP